MDRILDWSVRQMVMIVLVLVALAVLGPLFGADTRDGRDWNP